MYGMCCELLQLARLLQARCVSNWDMIVHFYSRASFVSPHAPPKRSQMAPRTVLAPGYTGWCLACPEAAVASTGGRSRTPLRGSRRARHTAHSTPSPSHRLSRVTMALPELPASSCAESVDSTSRPCSPEPERARGAAQPSQDRAARGPSGACRAAAKRVGVPEGGPLARTTVNVSGGYSKQQARV